MVGIQEFYHLKNPFVARRMIEIAHQWYAGRPTLLKTPYFFTSMDMVHSSSLPHGDTGRRTPFSFVLITRGKRKLDRTDLENTSMSWRIKTNWFWVCTFICNHVVCQFLHFWSDPFALRPKILHHSRGASVEICALNYGLLWTTEH